MIERKREREGDRVTECMRELATETIETEKRRFGVYMYRFRVLTKKKR